MSKDLRKVVLYIAESLDGYIATKEDSLDWLVSVEGEGDNGYGEFYDSVDTIIMGRRTYDWIMEQESGNFPYPGKQCFVYSERQVEDNEFVQFTKEDAKILLHRLRQEEGKKIWIVGGAQVIKAFQKQNLIDEYVINVAPVLLGQGIPLFTDGLEHALKLTGVRTFGQFVELSYISV